MSSPAGKPGTSPAETALSGLLLSHHFGWSEYQCISQSGWNCHFELSWHFQKLMGKGQRQYLYYCSSWTSSLFFFPFYFAASILHIVFQMTVLRSTGEPFVSVCLLKRGAGIFCTQIIESWSTYSNHSNVVYIWPARGYGQVWRPPEGFTGNMLIPVQRKMGVSGSSPTDTSMLGQSLCHCLGQMPNQGVLPWALQSQGLLCSWQFQGIYHSGTSSYSVRTKLLWTAWEHGRKV